MGLAVSIAGTKTVNVNNNDVDRISRAFALFSLTIVCDDSVLNYWGARKVILPVCLSSSD